jgi:hypothetical protein
MGWFRTNRIWAGRLALLALALQLVLSFGHHHPLPFSPACRPGPIFPPSQPIRITAPSAR